MYFRAFQGMCVHVLSYLSLLHVFHWQLLVRRLWRLPWRSWPWKKSSSLSSWPAPAAEAGATTTTRKGRLKLWWRGWGLARDCRSSARRSGTARREKRFRVIHKFISIASLKIISCLFNQRAGDRTYARLRIRREN